MFDYGYMFLYILVAIAFFALNALIAFAYCKVNKIPKDKMVDFAELVKTKPAFKVLNFVETIAEIAILYVINEKYGISIQLSFKTWLIQTLILTVVVLFVVFGSVAIRLLYDEWKYRRTHRK